MSQRNPIKPLRSRLAGLGLVVAVAHTISSRGYDSTGRSGGRVGFLLVAEALCPNSCSGHGTCGSDDVCHCYPDWGAVDAGSGDCSERYCPHEIAFVDFPDSLGNFHKYAECSAKGLCDRSSGECECFDGYTGKGCQRKTCPGEADGMPGVWCSGHGSCEFLDETTYGDHPGLYFDGSVKGLDGFVTPGIHDSFGIGFKAKADRMWESKKTNALRLRWRLVWSRLQLKTLPTRQRSCAPATQSCRYFEKSHPKHNNVCGRAIRQR